MSEKRIQAKKVFFWKEKGVCRERKFLFGCVSNGWLPQSKNEERDGGTTGNFHAVPGRCGVSVGVGWGARLV